MMLGAPRLDGNPLQHRQQPPTQVRGGVMLGGDADIAAVPGVTELHQAWDDDPQTHGGQVKHGVRLAQGRRCGFFLTGAQRLIQPGGVLLRQIGLAAGCPFWRRLHRLRQHTALEHATQLQRRRADRDPAFHPLLHPSQDRHIPFRVEAVAILGPLWRKKLVAPFPGAQRDGLDAGLGAHSLDREPRAVGEFVNFSHVSLLTGLSV